MNPFDLEKPPGDSDSGCPELLARAEQELAAFFRAVTELFGSEQAEVSAEDWLHELMTIDNLPASTLEWRSLTAKVSTRLASRVSLSIPSPVSQIF